MCRSRIIDDEEDALLCEGSCQKWFHRYCAGVSVSCYKTLSTSSAPFVCWVCSQELHRAVVSQLQAEIAALKEEVSELRKKELNSHLDFDTRPWTDVVSRGQRKTAVSALKSKSVAQGQTVQNVGIRSQPPSSSRSATVNPKPPTKSRGAGQHNRPSKRIEGKRKIWGTMKTTSVAAVKNSLKVITKIESDSLSIKRKYKTCTSGDGDTVRVSKWWFVVSGDEDFLQQLQKEWPSVKLQTNWSLEPVFCFDDSCTPPHLSTHNACPDPTVVPTLPEETLQQSTDPDPTPSQQGTD